VTLAEIERDVERMFSGNFRAWVSEGAGVWEPSAAEVVTAS